LYHLLATMAKRKATNNVALIEPDSCDEHLRKKHRECFNLAALALLSFKCIDGSPIEAMKVESSYKVEMGLLPIVEAVSDDESTVSETQSAVKPPVTRSAPAPPKMTPVGALRKPLGLPNQIMTRNVRNCMSKSYQLPAGRPLPPAPVLPRLFASDKMQPLQVL
jgi:hypothetical protein